VPASACSGGDDLALGRRRRCHPETIELIRDMAARGRLWGAKRIRGVRLKVGIKVSKRTIQKCMRGVHSRCGGGGQSWTTFLENHAERMWVCDFIQTHDLLFRQVYAFFLAHLASRRVVLVAATRHLMEAWTASALHAT
jgi:putative transposase